MLDLPDIQLWKSLFAIGKDLRHLEPWHEYSQKDLIIIEDSEQKEPIFCKILDTSPGFCGVSLYFGYQSFRGLQRIMQAGKYPPLHVILSNQCCLTQYFLSEEELTPEDKGFMELAEYSPPPGPLNCVSCRSYKPGFSPWYINNEEAKLLVKTLPSLYYGLMASQKSKIFSSSKEDKYLYITNAQTGQWQIETKPLPTLRAPEKTYKIKNEMLLARLKRQPRIAQALELESTFITAPLNHIGAFRLSLPRIVGIANHDEGTIEAHTILNPSDDPVEELLNLLFNYIATHGRPRLIIIRRDSLFSQINKVCEKIGITIEQRQNLEIIDDFLELVGNYAPGK